MKIKGNILVTGGCGFIGSHLVKKLVETGANVTVLDILLDPRSIFYLDKLKTQVNLKFIDIRDREKVLRAFENNKPDYVLHLAAQPIVTDAYKSPYETFNTNIMGTVNILDGARLSKNIKGIIVASSDKAYGKTTKSYRETDPLQGDHPYDVSKSCEDLIAQAYYKTYGLPIVVTRFGNVYGEGDLHFGRIIPDICKSIIQNKPLLIRSNGKSIRDYINVNDVACGYIFLINKMNKIKGEVFNFSSQENLSIIDLVKLVQKILKVKISYQILNNAKNEIPYQHLDYRKVKKLGWKQNYTMESSLGKVFTWYKGLKSFSS